MKNYNTFNTKESKFYVEIRLIKPSKKSEIRYLLVSDFITFPQPAS